MRIHALQHVPFEGLGHIDQWIRSHGHELSITHLYNNEPLPQVTDYDRLVVMGGPMNIYEEARYAWLKAEKACIDLAVKGGKTVIGVCLGAQLIADVLGARVYPGKEKEIGWFPIQLTPEATGSHLFENLPREFRVFHWHGDTFPLPADAVRLATSVGCENQAFLYDERILGLQFHLESTPMSVAKLMDHCRDELIPGPFIQHEEQITAADPSGFRQLHLVLEQLLDRLP